MTDLHESEHTPERASASSPPEPRGPEVLSGVSRAAIRRGVAVGAVSQVVAKLLHLAFNVVSTLAVVRYLTPSAYGVYAVVLTVTGIVTLVADFGLPKLAVREICAHADEERIVGSVIVLRLVLALAGVGVSELALFAMRQPAPAYAAGAVASLTGLGEALIASAVVVFQVRLAQQWEAALRTAAELLETTAILVLVARRADLVWLFVPPAATTACAGLLALALIRVRYSRSVHFDRDVARRLIRQALPIAPALLVGVVYHKLDSITLAALRHSRDIGLYSSAAQPVEYFFLTTALLMNTIYPLLSAAYSRGEKHRFATLYRRGTESLVIVTIAAPMTLLFVAEPLVRELFGRAYADAATPLVLLSIAVVPLTVTVWQALTLLVGGLQTVTLHYNLIALAISAALCLSLISVFGMVGAGCAAIGTALFVLIVSTRAVRRRMDVRLDWVALLRIGLASGAGVAVLAVLRTSGLPWPLLAIAGLVAFALAVRLTGAHRSLSGVIT